MAAFQLLGAVLAVCVALVAAQDCQLQPIGDFSFTGAHAIFYGDGPSTFFFNGTACPDLTTDTANCTIVASSIICDPLPTPIELVLKDVNNTYPTINILAITSVHLGLANYTNQAEIHAPEHSANVITKCGAVTFDVYAHTHGVATSNVTFHVSGQASSVVSILSEPELVIVPIVAIFGPAQLDFSINLTQAHNLQTLTVSVNNIAFQPDHTTYSFFTGYEQITINAAGTPGSYVTIDGSNQTNVVLSNSTATAIAVALNDAEFLCELQTYTITATYVNAQVESFTSSSNTKVSGTTASGYVLETSYNPINLTASTTSGSNCTIYYAGTNWPCNVDNVELTADQSQAIVAAYVSDDKVPIYHNTTVDLKRVQLCTVTDVSYNFNENILINCANTTGAVDCISYGTQATNVTFSYTVDPTCTQYSLEHWNGTAWVACSDNTCPFTAKSFNKFAFSFNKVPYGSGIGFAYNIANIDATVTVAGANTAAFTPTTNTYNVDAPCVDFTVTATITAGCPSCTVTVHGKASPATILSSTPAFDIVFANGASSFVYKYSVANDTPKVKGITTFPGSSQTLFTDDVISYEVYTGYNDITFNVENPANTTVKINGVAGAEQSFNLTTSWTTFTIDVSTEACVVATYTYNAKTVALTITSATTSGAKTQTGNDFVIGSTDPNVSLDVVFAYPNISCIIGNKNYTPCAIPSTFDISKAGQDFEVQPFIKTDAPLSFGPTYNFTFQWFPACAITVAKPTFTAPASDCKVNSTNSYHCFVGVTSAAAATTPSLSFDITANTVCNDLAVQYDNNGTWTNCKWSAAGSSVSANCSDLNVGFNQIQIVYNTVASTPVTTVLSSVHAVQSAFSVAAQDSISTPTTFSTEVTKYALGAPCTTFTLNPTLDNACTVCTLSLTKATTYNTSATTITVTAGTIHTSYPTFTYTYTVTPATVTKFSTTPGNYKATFAKDTTEYAFATAANSLTFEAATSDALDVVVDGTSHGSQFNTTVALGQVGATAAFNVTFEPAGGLSCASLFADTYHINAHRASTSLSSVAVSGAPLSPSFSANTFDYKAKVPQANFALTYSGPTDPAVQCRVIFGTEVIETTKCSISENLVLKTSPTTLTITVNVPTDSPSVTATVYKIEVSGVTAAGSSASKLSSGAIAGIVIGSIVGAVVIVLLAYLVILKKRASSPARKRLIDDGSSDA